MPRLSRRPVHWGYCVWNVHVSVDRSFRGNEKAYQSASIFVLLDVYGMIQVCEMVLFPPILRVPELFDGVFRAELSGA
jgi:hypothetical protein